MRYMVNRDVSYNEDVRRDALLVYSELRSKGYNVEIRLGDVYGPSRVSMSVQINFPRTYILCDPNSYVWRIGMFSSRDIEGARGVIFTTNISDASYFFRWLLGFLDGIDSSRKEVI